MPDAAPGSLDALMEFLAGYKDSAEAKMLVQAWIGAPAVEEASAEIEPVMDACGPDLEMVKADAAAQKLRADAAEARLLVIDAREIAADLKRANVTCDGFDADKPTIESVGKARAARDAAALAALRTDRAETSRYIAPTNPGSDGSTVRVPSTLSFS
jgi:hypothetical protein